MNDKEELKRISKSGTFKPQKSQSFISKNVEENPEAMIKSGLSDWKRASWYSKYK